MTPRSELSSRMLHPLIQEARGMCSDECPHVEIDGVLGEVLDAAKDLEDEVERLREALEHAAEYLSILDTLKGRTAVAGIIRDALNAREEA